MQLLHVDSSILGANSASRQLTADVVQVIGRTATLFREKPEVIE